MNHHGGPRATMAMVTVLMLRLGATWAAEAPCACADLARSVGALEAAWVEQSSYIARLESRIAALENHGMEASDKPSAGVAPGRPAGRELLMSSSAPTRICSSSVQTPAVDTTQLNAETINVTNLYVGSIFAWQGQPIGFRSPSPVPTPAPTPAPASCADHAGGTNGWYSIKHTDGAYLTVWCSFTSTGAWRVGVLPMPLDSNCFSSSVTSPAEYSALCAANGYPLAGRGVAASPEAWLVQKRMLWDSNHALRQGGWPTGCGHMPMPVMFVAAASTVLSIFDGAVAVLPPNNGGDHCHSGGTETYCEYWYNTGWSVDDSDYPDPEDWGSVHCGSCTDRFISCIGLEA